MKVPLPANNQNNSKILNSITNTTRNTASPTIPTATPTTNRSLGEPKSVLDLGRSLSPVPDQKPAPNTVTTDTLPAACDDPLQLEDHALIHQNLDDWDSLMRELGLHDDCTPVSKPIPQFFNSHSDHTQTHYSPLPEFPVITSFDSTDQFAPVDFGLLSDIPTTNSIDDLNIGSWSVDDLIRLAECLETNSLELTHVILARLNQSLKSPTGKPLQRAAFYFKEAIQSLLTGSTRQWKQPASSQEIIQNIAAQKIFSSISPVPLFASFTANQAVLEAVDGSTHVHVIDFDIGLGGQWASFMKELAEKATPQVLRVSAVVPENYAVESRLIRENLAQFARELNITFSIEFVLIQTFKYLSFKAVKFIDGENLAILLSPNIFRQVGTGFVSDLRRVSPHVIVHVDTEGQLGSGTSSCRQTLIDGLDFYSTLLESLEATNFNGGDDWMRRIEMFVLFPKILEAAGRGRTPWREAALAAGLRQVGPSRFADFQAEFLLRRVQGVRGFHVVKRQAEMLLCWHDRPLAATSAWRTY